MLSTDEKARIRDHIHSQAEEILRKAQDNRRSGMPEAQLIEQTVTLAVNKFTVESKMLTTSVYNMLSKHTLAKPLFQNPMNQMAFYELDLPKQLRQKFDYTVPQHIDYQKAQKQVYAYVGAGAVAATGGVVSICMESWVPVTVAVLIAGIMAAVLYTNSQKRKQNVEQLIQEYLDAIEASMMDWVGSIEEYYDKQTAVLERKVLENNG